MVQDIDTQAKHMAAHLINLARALEQSHPMTASDMKQAAYLLKILVKRAEIEKESNT